MSEIVDLANSLGKAIAQSPAATKLREARKALNAESDLLKLLEEYHAQSDKMSKLEAENKIIEVEDKHKLQALHDKLVASDTFKKFTAAQMDYVDLMRQVNAALRKQLSETEQ